MSVRSNLIRWYQKNFSKLKYKKFNAMLLKMALNGLGVLNHQNNQLSGEEYFIKTTLSNLLNKETPILFDVGANCGGYALSLIAHHPKAKIHCFEPVQNNFNKLKANLKDAQNVVLNLSAAGDCNGEITIYDKVDTGGTSHATLYPKILDELHISKSEPIKAQITRIDDYSNKNNI
jgi:FkbM family methyltransferase